MPQKTFPMTEKTRIKRGANRASYDRDLAYQIIDEAMVCHVGFAVKDQPYVIPTFPWRVGDFLYIHGAKGGHMPGQVADGGKACIDITLLDGLVLARSAFHHSVNYRSVIVFGEGQRVDHVEEKADLLDRMITKIDPARARAVRAANKKELARTSVIGFGLKEVSVKVRSGPPVDDEEDYALPVWAGVLPVSLTAGGLQTDPQLMADVPMPDAAAWSVFGAPQQR
ncbi:MAG: pyridoxamine 5'-phosphate oxidase family protein [Gammaproteobacteria bacterium]|nr:pyridoxamine 5'-phosphate oxidase family protein [Gammaproteobacteria bacterium]